jgi:hypothetical protein
MVTDSNLSTHADDVFAELQNYLAGTGSFINYYVPQGHGAVITCRRSPSPTFHKLRKPHPSYFGGDVLITTNSETDGSYTPSGGSFMADYYDDLETAGQTATIQGHWDVMGSTGLHQMTIGYRDRRDLTIWFDGRLSSGRTSRVELEWADLDTRCELKLVVAAGSRGTIDIDPNQPLYEPNQVITLTATPNPGETFKNWRIYDPAHPGEAGYATIDSNHAITLVMATDRHVRATFECGSSSALPLLGIACMLLCIMLRERR